jgi:hypothetical protein
MRRLIITFAALTAMLVPAATSEAATWEEPLDCPGRSYYDPAVGECVGPTTDCPDGLEYDVVNDECYDPRPALPKWHKCRPDNAIMIQRLRVTRAACWEANEAADRVLKRKWDGRHSNRLRIQDYNCKISKLIIDGRGVVAGEPVATWHWNVKCNGRRWQHPVVKFRIVDGTLL